MSKTALFFCCLCLVSLLEAREWLVITFDESQSVLQKRLPAVQKELHTLKISPSTVTIKRFGDRFALTLPLESLTQKEKLLVSLGTKYPHSFVIELPDAPVSGALAAFTKSSTKETPRLWLWIVMIIFTSAVALLFGRGFTELLRLRRLQRFMQQQQLKIKKELEELR